MKKHTLLLWAICLTLPLCAQQRGEIKIPNLNGFLTLKCDFHIHTVFSDGTVWPTIRVQEAYREGLDAIAITDHVEAGYRPRRNDVVGSHNRAYEVAVAEAERRDIILIRGAEVSRSMPPGHLNALFLIDADELDKPDYTDALRAAQSQNAFIKWNHPCWDAQQPDTTLWFPEHTALLEQGLIQGIEVVNEGMYCPEAHQWCLDKNLTMFGSDDIHGPLMPFAPGKHRAMTLVFAQSRTQEGIMEALKAGRTAVYFEEYIIGREVFLKELFENAVEITVEKTAANRARITFNNTSDLVFHLRKAPHDPRLTYFRNVTLHPYIIQPQSTQTISVRLNDGIEHGDVNLIIENFLVGVGEGMRYTVKI